MAFTLPDLAYSYDALAPHIDARTMEIHHGKHHRGYVNNLNKALAGTALADSNCVFEVCSRLDEVPEAQRSAIRNNGGGHANHSLFWEILTPQSTGQPAGDLAVAIDVAFGSFEDLKQAFSQAAATRFGSGWAWLCKDADNKLFVCSTPNQDNPVMKGVVERTGTPILGLDVWEHAYYLNYQNRRPDYIAAFWNLVNWEHVAERYAFEAASHGARAKAR